MPNEAIFTRDGKALFVKFNSVSGYKDNFASYFKIASSVDNSCSQCHSVIRFDIYGHTYLKKYSEESKSYKFYEVIEPVTNKFREVDLILDVIFLNDDDFAIENSKNTPDPHNNVSHPNHYNQGGIEVWDVINAFTKDLKGVEAFYAGNVIKYVLRWNHKNGIEDLEKAKVYINKIIEGRKEQ